MKEVKIRHCRVNDNWIVMVNGIPKTATNVIIEVPTYTTKDKIWDKILGTTVEYVHMSCESNEVQYKGDIIIIK